MILADKAAPDKHIPSPGIPSTPPRRDRPARTYQRRTERYRRKSQAEICITKTGSNCTDYTTLVNATARKLKMDRVIPYTNSGVTCAANRMPWHLFRWYSRCSRCTGYDPSAACHLHRDVRLTKNHSCKNIDAAPNTRHRPLQRSSVGTPCAE